MILKNSKKIFISIITVCLTACLFTINTFAQGTYVSIPKNTCTFIHFESGSSSYVSRDYYMKWTEDVRLVAVYALNANSSGTSNYYRLRAWSDKSFSYQGYTDSSCTVKEKYANSLSNSSGAYYYINSLYSYSLGASFNNYPLNLVSKDNDIIDSRNLAFGSNASEWSPEPEVTYGNLVNLGLGTQYLTNREFAMNENIDTIHWNSSYDSLGNDIKDFNVKIRAVQTEYVSGTVGELAALNWQDVRIKDKTYNLGIFSASSGKASFTWGQVVGGLNLASYMKTQINDNSQYSTQGWYYEVQLYGDNYEGEWQKVYTMSSSPPANQTTFKKENNFNQGIVTSVNNVVSRNQTSNNNTYNYENTYNNIVINNNNSNYQDNVDGKPWYAWLLEAITSLFGKLIDLIGGAFSDLISGLVDLIKTLGVDVIGFFTNIFNRLQDLLTSLDFENNLDLNPDISDNLELLDIPKILLQGFFDAGLGYMILIPLVLGIIFKVF